MDALSKKEEGEEEGNPIHLVFRFPFRTERVIGLTVEQLKSNTSPINIQPPQRSCVLELPNKYCCYIH